MSHLKERQMLSYFILWKQYFFVKIPEYIDQWGYVMAQLVEALCYEPEDKGFDSRWGNFD